MGCTAHAHELSAWFEDEITGHRRLLDLYTASPPQMAGELLRYAGAGRPPLARARALSDALSSAARLGTVVGTASGGQSPRRPRSWP